jgi:hypothetical protein
MVQQKNLLRTAVYDPITRKIEADGAPVHDQYLATWCCFAYMVRL